MSSNNNQVSKLRIKSRFGLSMVVHICSWAFRRLGQEEKLEYRLGYKARFFLK
jgi:hypothetical protein